MFGHSKRKPRWRRCESLQRSTESVMCIPCWKRVCYFRSLRKHLEGENLVLCSVVLVSMRTMRTSGVWGANPSRAFCVCVDLHGVPLVLEKRVYFFSFQSLVQPISITFFSVLGGIDRCAKVTNILTVLCEICGGVGRCTFTYSRAWPGWLAGGTKDIAGHGRTRRCPSRCGCCSGGKMFCIRYLLVVYQLDVL